jgi:hypothetical protein
MDGRVDPRNAYQGCMCRRIEAQSHRCSMRRACSGAAVKELDKCTAQGMKI